MHKSLFVRKWYQAMMFFVLFTLFTPGCARIDEHLIVTANRQLLKEDNPAVRYVGTRMLGSRRDKKAVPQLVELLLKDPYPAVRYEAAKALGEIGDPRALEPLKKALEDEGEAWIDFTSTGKERLGVVREAASEAIKKIELRSH